MNPMFILSAVIERGEFQNHFIIIIIFDLFWAATPKQEIELTRN